MFRKFLNGTIDDETVCRVIPGDIFQTADGVILKFCEDVKKDCVLE